MSKSKGEFLTLSLLKEKGYTPLVYRLFCLNSHYRKTLVFSYDALDQTKIQYEKLIRKVKSLNKEGFLNEKSFNEYQNKFKSSIGNDLNTASALTILYDVLKDDTLNDLTKLKLVESFDQVLSLDLLKEDEIDNDLKTYIEEKIKERNKAKQNKNFALADNIRNELLEKNIILKDTREGTTYEKR